MEEFDLNLIRTFLEVYRTGSFTLAGNNLNVSQPSVSAAIRKMEALIGYQLFVKQGRGIAPTASAHKLANRCQNAFSDIINAISDQANFNVYAVEDLIHSLMEIKDIQIHESSLDQFQIIQQLKNQSVDLAIAVFTIKDPSLVIEPLFSEPAVVVCKENHPTIGNEISKEQFYQMEHIILTTQWDNLSGFEYGALEPVQERTHKIKVGSKSTKLHLVSSSNAIAVVPLSFANKWKDALNIKILASPIELREVSYSLAYHKRYVGSEQHKILRKKIKNRVRAL